MLIEKNKGLKIHGISEILAYVDCEKSSRDSLYWLVNSYRAEQPAHLSYLRSLYSPSRISLLNLLVYSELKRADQTLLHPDLEAAISAALPEIKRVEAQAAVQQAPTVPTPAPAKQTGGETKQATTKVPRKKAEEAPAEYLQQINGASLKRSNKGQHIRVDPNRRNVLITSALPYVNNEPHLGNLIGAVLSADVFARYSRQMGYNTLYICGTDEYGTATETKALLEGKSPKEICDHYNKLHTEIYEAFAIDFDYFGRTSTPKHTEIVQEIFKDCDAQGFMQQNTVDQLYCDHCQRFIADRFVIGRCPAPGCGYEKASGDQCDKCQTTFEAVELQDPRCSVCNKPVSQRSSEHLFLDLQKVEPELRAFVDATSNKKGIWTSNSVAITQGWFKTGLRPRCITRDLKWGVPVPKPGFENKCFYVWFDAPIGYISITAAFMNEHWREWWMARDGGVELFQFMGKDNVPFHTILFPGFLLATRRPWTLLQHISTTEYLNYEEEKFSKRNSIGVFGGDVTKMSIPIECWRYYLLSVRPEGADTQFKWTDFASRVNNDLLGNFGNLCNRILKFIHSNCGARIPQLDRAQLTEWAN